MKNKEKYLDEIINASVEVLAFSKSGEVTRCGMLECNECIFNEWDKSCVDAWREWLEEEYKKSIELSKDEKAILRNIDKRYKYIVRSFDMLEVFEAKPYRTFAGGWGRDKGVGNVIRVFNHLFQFIKNEDEEPYSIEDLLRESEAENE